MGCGNSSRVKKPSNDVNNQSNIAILSKHKSPLLDSRILSLENKDEFSKHYKVIEKIGKGCFGKVYKVFHQESEQFRALKIVNKKTMCLQDDRQKFLKEIEVLIQIDHPNIIKLYEYFIADTSYYVIVELACGCELMETLMKLNYYSEIEAAVIMQQLLSCVAYLHSKGMIHRDLKPENIMVESSSQSELNIKLIDFGSAYSVNSNPSMIQEVGSNRHRRKSENGHNHNHMKNIFNMNNNNNNKNISDTNTNNINNTTGQSKIIDFNNFNFDNLNTKLKLQIGTPFYMAPEVICGRYNNKCDLWSLGVIMYILLCGEPPFFGDDDYETFKLIHIGHYDTSSKPWDTVSSAAKFLLAKLLNKDPINRISAEKALLDPWIVNNVSYYEKKINKKNGKENITEALQNGENNLQIKSKIISFSAEQRLQQAIVAYLIHNFASNENCRQLKKVFKKIDSSGDGRLSYDELKAGVNQYFIGFSLNDAEFAEYVKCLDKDNSGYIEYEEFLTEFLHREYLLNEKNLNNAFNSFDTDKSGKLSINEIKSVMWMLQENQESHIFLKNLIKKIDLNGDGEISIAEFKHLMKKAVEVQMQE